MVERLSLGAASVSDLARPFAMSLSAVMQHLAVLEGAGLVVSEKAGRVRTCRIDASGLSRAEAWIGARRSEWEGRLNRLAAYLDDTKEGGGDAAKS